MQFLVHYTISALRVATWGCKKRSLLYYCAFRYYRATSRQPGTAQVIIPTTHLFRRKMVENGGNGAEGECLALPGQVDDDAFGLSHNLKFSAKIHK